ncbi:MAG: preprotein translocase subunit SecG [Chitinophagales bacterium]|nr:preprotein translocase subunit SecG [Bacteroidota bacterium]MCB9227158.1 preprotein translocase subunit SecG [Chitinophagales bacterium]
MYIVLSIFILLLCVLLSMVILVQNPKGGGLTQSLGGVSNQVFGAKNSTGLVEKVTWYLAGAIVALCIVSVIFISGTTQIDETPATNAEKIIESGEMPTNFNPNQGIETLPEGTEALPTE